MTTKNNSNGWMAYVTSVKEILKRHLSKKEISQVMEGYLNRKNVERMADELK